MGEWCYALGSIEFSTLFKDNDFSKYYIENVLKLNNTKLEYFLNKKWDNKGWILTFNNTIKEGIFIGDVENTIKSFIRTLYQYFAINNVTVSIYNDCGTCISLDSIFLDSDEEIQRIDKENNYDTNTLRFKNQKEYINRYSQKQWETIRDMCLSLSSKDFDDLVKVVKEYHKKD